MAHERRPLITSDGDDYGTLEKLIPPDSPELGHARARNSVWLGVCFFLVMAANGCMMGLLTSLFSSVGFVVHILVYFIFIFSTFFGASLIDFIDVKPTFLLAAFGYLLLFGAGLGSFYLGSPWLVVVGGVSIGLSSGPIWLAQGVYLARLTAAKPTTVGKHTGHFWSIFSIGGIFGNALGAYIFFENGGGGPSEHLVIKLMWSLLALSGCGFIAFLFLPPPPPSIEPHILGVAQRSRMIWKAFLNKPLMVWVPSRLLYGAINAYVLVSLPRLMEVRYVPWAFMGYALTQFIVSNPVGAAIDKLSPKVLFWIYVFMIATAMGLVPLGVYVHPLETHFDNTSVIDTDLEIPIANISDFLEDPALHGWDPREFFVNMPYILIGACSLFGGSDMWVNTVLIAFITQRLGRHATGSLAIIRMCAGAGFITSGLLLLWIPWYYVLPALAATLIPSAFLILTADVPKSTKELAAAHPVPVARMEEKHTTHIVLGGVGPGDLPHLVPHTYEEPDTLSEMELSDVERTYKTKTRSADSNRSADSEK